MARSKSVDHMDDLVARWTTTPRVVITVPSATLVTISVTSMAREADRIQKRERRGEQTIACALIVERWQGAPHRGPIARHEGPSA
jgi:hypothetical protein